MIEFYTFFSILAGVESWKLALFGAIALEITPVAPIGSLKLMRFRDHDRAGASSDWQLDRPSAAKGRWLWKR